MIKDKFITLMADYSSSGLWGSDGVMVPIECIDVTDELEIRIENWCNWYEKNMDWLTPEPSPFFNKEEFSTAGNLIAVEIKKQHMDWQVEYFNENTLEREVI